MAVKRVLIKFGLLLSKHQKLRIIELSVLMIIGGLLETFSVSMMIPFVDAVMDPEAAMEKWYAKIVCDLFKIDDGKNFLIVLSIVLAIFYIAKNVYLSLEYNLQYKFVYGNMLDLQERLLDSFIHRPYEFFLNVKSGDVIRVIGSDVRDAFDLLVVMLVMFTEIVVALMLMVAVFVISPSMTLCIAIVLLLLLGIIYFILRPVMRRMGLSRQSSASEMNKWILQSIQGIKELKVTQKETFFKDNYIRSGRVYVNSIRWQQTLDIMPRFVIESICMGGIFITVAILIGNNAGLESVVPSLSAVAMAGIRLLPSINRISGALNKVSYNEPMLDRVIENVQEMNRIDVLGEDDAREKPLQGKEKNNHKKIEIKKVTYHYPQSKENVLIDASMTVNKGEFIGIVGSSGAGKTTVVDLVLGLLQPNKGEILFDGIDVNDDVSAWLAKIGYIPQTIFMLDDTIRANVAFGVKERDINDERVWDAIKGAALDEFILSLPEGLDTQIGERGVRMSGGQRQRVGIARALYQNPEIMIFDEATSALDNDTEKEIMKSIHDLRGNKTIIIIAHRLTTIEDCDHIFRVENGKIIQER